MYFVTVILLIDCYSSTAGQRVYFVTGIVNVLMTTPLWVVNTRLKLQGATFRTKDLEYSKTRKYKGIIGEYYL